VSKILVSKHDARKLASRFADEESTDEVRGYSDKLEELVVEEWTKIEGNEQTSFSPSVTQWNFLVGHVNSLKDELQKALEATIKWYICADQWGLTLMW
jgi:phage-related minor tail protein